MVIVVKIQFKIPSQHSPEGTKENYETLWFWIATSLVRFKLGTSEYKLVMMSL